MYYLILNNRKLTLKHSLYQLILPLDSSIIYSDCKNEIPTTELWDLYILKIIFHIQTGPLQRNAICMQVTDLAPSFVIGNSLLMEHRMCQWTCKNSSNSYYPYRI
jgi:hypothetical protein